MPWSVSRRCSHITQPRNRQATIRLSRTLAAPVIANVATFVPMMSATGKMKFSQMLALGEAEASRSVSSRPIIGFAPSRSTLPVWRARSSAARMGPKSGSHSEAMAPTITMVRNA